MTIELTWHLILMVIVSVILIVGMFIGDEGSLNLNSFFYGFILVILWLIYILMVTAKAKRHIPSRYITYKFVCRNCGEAGIGEFDKFTDPKNRMDIYCDDCQYGGDVSDLRGEDEDWELPF